MADAPPPSAYYLSSMEECAAIRDTCVQMCDQGRADVRIQSRAGINERGRGARAITQPYTHTCYINTFIHTCTNHSFHAPPPPPTPTHPAPLSHPLHPSRRHVRPVTSSRPPRHVPRVHPCHVPHVHPVKSSRPAGEAPRVPALPAARTGPPAVE